jgi:DNA mismatch repair protein MLH3
MPEFQPEIERLAPSTRAKLRSTQILTSLPQIVSELIQNSLDANPSQIHIGLDCKEWTCWVQDDGHGISKEDLEKLGQGQDGGRYSKLGYMLNSLEDCSKLSRNLQNVLAQLFQFSFRPYIWLSGRRYVL